MPCARVRPHKRLSGYEELVYEATAALMGEAVVGKHAPDVQVLAISRLHHPPTALLPPSHRPCAALPPPFSDLPWR